MQALGASGIKAARDNRLRVLRFLTRVLIVIVAVAITHIASGLPFLELVHLKARDFHFITRGSLPTEGIVLLVIDQKSLDHFPEPLMFWHGYYAEAIHAAAGAGAKVIGLDIAFPIPVNQWVGGLDEKMAEAIVLTSQTMPVVAGYAGSAMGKQTDWPVPFNMAAISLGQTAFVNLHADGDDFIRGMELIEAGEDTPEKPLMRSLSLRSLEKALGKDSLYRDGKLIVAGHEVPFVYDRTMLINYAGPAGTFPRVSLSDFIEAARAGETDKLKRWVGGKIILFGPDIISDRHATPFYAFRTGLPANTAGVEIHANSAWTMMTGNFLVPVAQGWRLAAMTATAAGAVWLTTILTGWTLVALLGLAALGLTLTTHILFRYGQLLSTTELILCSIAALMLSLLYNYFTAQRKSAAFRTAVQVFVGKTVAEQVEKAGTYSLHTRRRLVTIMFTDIRGFTSFCESQEPEVVIAKLNEYFAVMVSTIVRYGGHVNKFIGDGIMAFFSEEDEVPGDHAVRAVKCAVEMVQYPSEFSTGAGIHTGFVVVGNVGSGDKMDYTALGDTVNLAARMESLNKDFHSKVLMTEATKERVEHKIETVRLGDSAVKGKTARQAAYTVKELLKT